MSENDWLKRANCRNVDPELFFTDQGTEDYYENTRQAVAVCLACEVRRDCIIECAQTVATWQTCGVWAGTTNSGRRRLNREAVGKGQVTVAQIPLPSYVPDEWAESA